MALISPWDDSASRHWLPALSLPTLEWTQPFIPLLGWPQELLEQPETWLSIYGWAKQEHQTRLEAGYWAVGKPGGRGGLVREVVIQALEKLAEEMGENVAINLGGWVLFHFFCSEARVAMHQWQVVLRYIYEKEYFRYSRRWKVPAPQPLESLGLEIYHDINFAHRQKIETHIKEVAPPPPEELIPYERMDNCYEATVLRKAVDQAMTLKALRYIASKLEVSQRQGVVDWAEKQFVKSSLRYGYTYIEDLCEDKYLTPDLPWANLPSVFELPTQGEIDWHSKR
ncbi:MAG: hypothetical protein WBG70_14265 [Spirulinaceae cyanobacterium]